MSPTGSTGSAGRGRGHAASDAEGARKRGRPPRVSRAQIAEAALALGLERATIRSVARQLGMSVPGLYHHVRTRRELIALAADHGFAALRLPEDTGQPWAAWLVAYGRFVHDALVAQPALVAQILAGRVDTLRQTQHLERFFAVLERHGFEIAEAYATYVQLTAAVIGAAAAEIGRQAAAAGGHATRRELRGAARRLGVRAVPHVIALLETSQLEPEPFETVELVVRGIASRRRASARRGASARGSGRERSPRPGRA